MLVMQFDRWKAPELKNIEKNAHNLWKRFWTVDRGFYPGFDLCFRSIKLIFFYISTYSNASTSN